MPRSLPTTIDQEIIDRYIYGESTSDIEQDLNVSHGAVMDRVSKITYQLRKRDVNAIRTVTLALKKAKIRWNITK